jgi:hypothetical protein
MSKKSNARGVIMNGSQEFPMSGDAQNANPITLTEKKENEITNGLCHCRCGEKTNIYKRNYPKSGIWKGEYPSWLPGHSRKNKFGSDTNRWKGGTRLDKSGYMLVMNPEHPRSCKGYVYEHVLIAERVLGKQLPNGVVIHHSNKQKASNENSNLVICQDNSYHQLLHQRMRAYEACGHASWRKCSYCKNYSPISDVILVQHHAYHRSCQNKYYKSKREKISRNLIK